MGAPSLDLLKKKTPASVKEDPSVPVNITKTPKAKALAFLNDIGVSLEQVVWLKNSSYQVALISSGLDLNVEDKIDEKTFVGVSEHTQEQIKSGDLEEIELIDLKEQVEAAIQYLQSLPQPKISVLDKLPQEGSGFNALATKPDVCFPLDTMQTADRVKLRDASVLYQPVRASDADSRYFLVAANEKIKVACRYKNGKMSFRVEGDDLGEHTNYLSGFGFNPNGSYCSMHFGITDDVLASKTLASVVFGLGMTWSTGVPVLSVIKGKGK